MSKKLNHKSYAFAEYELDSARRRLTRVGQPVALNAKAFDLLTALVENAGQDMSKDQLMELVWPGQFVEEANLTVQISALRRALDERKGEHRFIATVPGRGYRFIAAVHELTEEPEAVVIESRTTSQVFIEDEYELSEDGGRRLLPVNQTTNIVKLPPAQTLTRSSAASSPTRPRRPSYVLLATGSALLLLLAIGGISYWNYREKTASRPSEPARFRQIKITRLTTNGKVRDAALSPDGKFIAYIVDDAGTASMWLRQVGTASDVMVRPATAEAVYSYPTFSPDGVSLYFIEERDGQPPTLYRTPLLGGPSEKVLSNVSMPVSLSPDGQQIAFIQRDLENGDYALMLAQAKDGSRESKLAVRKQHERFSISGRIAWSPDSRMIAVGAVVDEGFNWQVLLVNVGDGSVKPLSEQKWAYIASLNWLSDNSGLVMLAQAITEREFWQPWYLSYPGGEARKIVNDTNGYGTSSVSLSADGKSLGLVQANLTSNLWLLPNEDMSQAKQLTFDAVGREAGRWGLAWTPDGQIVYHAFVGHNHSFWAMSAKGGASRPLLQGEQALENLSITADGRYMVFTSNRSGRFEIWRADLDGHNLKQLTTTGRNYIPQVTPDNQSVIYKAVQADGNNTVWRVSLNGGAPVRLTEAKVDWPRIAPDGKHIACRYQGKPALLSVAGNEPIRTFPRPPTASMDMGFGWLPDSSALVYFDRYRGIWVQPLAGGEPVRRYEQEAEKLFNLAWSPDGKQLTVAKGTETRDVVLIEDLR